MPRGHNGSRVAQRVIRTRRASPVPCVPARSVSGSGAWIASEILDGARGLAAGRAAGQRGDRSGRQAGIRRFEMTGRRPRGLMRLRQETGRDVIHPSCEGVAWQAGKHGNASEGGDDLSFHGETRSLSWKPVAPSLESGHPDPTVTARKKPFTWSAPSSRGPYPLSPGGWTSWDAVRDARRPARRAHPSWVGEIGSLLSRPSAFLSSRVIGPSARGIGHRGWAEGPASRVHHGGQADGRFEPSCYQRRRRGPRSAPTSVHSAMVPPYQTATNGTVSSMQCSE